jgi:hypothetical protein
VNFSATQLMQQKIREGRPRPINMIYTCTDWCLIKINLNILMASKKEKIFFNDIMHLRMQKNIKVMIVKESFKRFLN